MMINFYDIDLIPIILRRFKVETIIIGELSDENVMAKINEYLNNNNASSISIYSNNEKQADFNDCPLNVLHNLSDFDAVFLDDDPNWYTTYNELNIIKQNNEEFPLVFICNNVFPHKFRDSYSNPGIIPDEFKNEFSRELFLNNNIKIRDSYFHALEEHTPKNGVFTAINDFLAENSSIGIMDIKFINGIIILYPKNSISQIRLSALSEEINNYSLDIDNLSDGIIENKLLSDYISKFNISEEELNIIDGFQTELDEKEKIINDFEDKVKFHDEELSYKNTQITGVNSELSLKEAQIKNFESKLVNKETEINNLNSELKNVTEELDSLKSELIQKGEEFKNKEIEFKSKEEDFIQKSEEFKNKEEDFIQKSEEFKNKELEFNNQLLEQFNASSNFESELKMKQDQLNLEKRKLKDIKHQYNNQLAKLDNKEYCISCFKEEIKNNHLEIQYLKNDSLTRKILNPFSYLYLLIKSNPRDLSLNYKLYRAIKNSKCFDIGFYLNNNKDLKESNWCKYFSPELHYVCNGFNEKRKFNKKYFNRNSKEELLNYILNCDK